MSRQQIIDLINSTPLLTSAEKNDYLAQINNLPDNQIPALAASLSGALEFYQQQESAFVSRTHKLSHQYSEIFSQKLAQETGVPTPPQVKQALSTSIKSLTKKYLDTVLNPDPPTPQS